MPDDYVPSSEAPVVPPPLALQGPINFDEVEFPIATDMSNFSTGTLNGAGTVGDTIDYSFTVTNTGDTTLTDITITDPLITVNGGLEM